MNNTGKALLSIGRSFHRWHKNHVAVSTLLIGSSALVYLLTSYFRFSENWRRVSETLRQADETIGYFTAAFFVASVASALLMKLLAQIWPAPYVPLLTALPEPLFSPKGNHSVFGDFLGRKVRYRFASHSELAVFVDFSEGDPAIENEYPGLIRQDLYQRWLSCNEDTFMVLEVCDPGNPLWQIRAVSIVLPLTEKGYDKLWAGEIDVPKLDRTHIAAKGKRPKAILIDTLICEPKHKNAIKALVFALPTAHISRFWIPQGRKHMQLLVQPSHKRFPKILPEMGFEGPHIGCGGHRLYRDSYPPRPALQTERQRETTQRLITNIQTAARWSILR